MSRLLVLYCLYHLTVIFTMSDFIQQQLTFSTSQAQELWQNIKILGNSTHFNYPLSMGTATPCDSTVIDNVFDDNYKLDSKYTEWDTSMNLDEISSGYVAKGFGFRNLPKADLKIASDVVSLKACFTACITMKHFVCREFDFYKKEGNICSLFKTNGWIGGNTRSPEFVGSLPNSDHYTIFKRNQDPPSCNLTDSDYAHPYFALGWKAMESGWYTLAHDQFQKAIERDEQYYMAYIGKCLSYEDMGYGIKDRYFGSCKEKLLEIEQQPDVEARLTYQELLILKALVALHKSESLDEGLKAMSAVVEADQTTKKNYIIRVIEGNALLLTSDAFSPLAAHSVDNIFAIQYLTHNLNPYKNGKGKTTLRLREAAKSAVFNFKSLEVDGAWRITSDCIDIAEYYSKWSIAADRLDSQRVFLYRNTGDQSDSLFREDGEDIIVNGLDVKYMSRSLKRIAEYERLHFFYLQMAKFNNAKTHLESKIKKDDDEQQKHLRYRMAANAFFTTHGYIYDEYAKEITFENDWTKPLDNNNDLALASRAYYWTAVAVQNLEKGSSKDVSTIISKLNAAQKKVSYNQYRDLISMYTAIVKGTQQFVNKKYTDALKSAKLAGKKNNVLAKADFTIRGNEESKYFRLLIPLGYQFQADMMNSLSKNTESADALEKSLTKDNIIEAYDTAVHTPPLNTSRLIKAYGDALFDKYGDAPKRRDDELPSYIQYYQTLINAWEESDPAPEQLPAKGKVEKTIDSYYDRPFTDCSADEFQIRSEKELCWGGYVIIGISAAIVVIIAIIIGILCLRRKAVAPQKDKEKAQEFMFTGPDLSQRDDYNGSFHMGSLRRSSLESPHYASQTLDIKRNYNDSDYTARSQTMGGGFTEAYSAH